MLSRVLPFKLSGWREYSKKDTASALVTGSAGAGVAAVVQITVGMVTVAILARWLGPESKGNFDLCFATANVLMLIVGFSLPSGVVYSVASGQSSPRALVRGLNWILMVQTALGAVLLAALSISPWRHFFLPKGDAYVVIFLISCIVGAILYASAFRSVLMGQKEFLRASGVDIGKQIVLLLALAGLVGAMNLSGNTVSYPSTLAIYAFSIACGALLSLKAISRSHTDGPSGLRSVFSYSAPCYFANLVQVVNYRLDAFMVNWFCGASTLGIYQLAATISDGFSLIPGTIASLLLPAVASSQGGSQEMALLTVRVTRVVAVAVAVAWIIISIGGYLFIPLVFGVSFRSSVPLLFVLLFGRVLGVYTGIFAGYLAGLGRPSLNMIVSVISALVNILVQFILIPRFGAMGAALGTLTAAFCSAILTSFILVRCSSLRAIELVPHLPEDLRTTRDLLMKIRHRVVARKD